MYFIPVQFVTCAAVGMFTVLLLQKRGMDSFTNKHVMCIFVHHCTQYFCIHFYFCTRIYFSYLLVRIPRCRAAGHFHFPVFFSDTVYVWGSLFQKELTYFFSFLPDSFWEKVAFQHNLRDKVSGVWLNIVLDSTDSTLFMHTLCLHAGHILPLVKRMIWLLFLGHPFSLLFAQYQKHRIALKRQLKPRQAKPTESADLFLSSAGRICTSTSLNTAMHKKLLGYRFCPSSIPTQLKVYSKLSCHFSTGSVS